MGEKTTQNMSLRILHHAKDIKSYYSVKIREGNFILASVFHFISLDRRVM